MYIQFLIHVLSNIIKREEFFMMNFTNHETVKLSSKNSLSRENTESYFLISRFGTFIGMQRLRKRHLDAQ